MKTDSTKNTARRHESPIANFAQMMASPASYAQQLATRGTAYADILASVSPIRKPAKPEEPATAGKLIAGGAFMKAWAPPDWIFRGMLQRNQLVTLTAHPNHGKTSLAVYMAVCLAAGICIGKHECTRKGRVLYLAGDGDYDVRNRLIATTQLLSVSPAELDLRLAIYPDSGHLPTIYETIERESKGAAFDLVVIDTASAYFRGVNENDNAEAQEHAYNAQRFTKLPGNPAVLMLAHPTKDAQRGEQLKPRGGGSMFGAIDGNWDMWFDGETFELRQGKKRGPAFASLSFAKEELELAGIRDDRGMPITEIALRPIDSVAQARLSSARTAKQDKVIIAAHDNDSPTILKLAELCGFFYKTGDPDTSTTRRILVELTSLKLFEKMRDGRYRLTAKGKEEAQSLSGRTTAEG